MTTPKFYPRAQFTGIIRWSCCFCGRINQSQIKPGTVRIQCAQCDRYLFYGLAFHIPMNSASRTPKDYVIPSWENEEYPYDTISERVQESMKAAFMDPNRKLPQRGRVHVMLLHESIYLAGDNFQEPDEDNHQQDD